MGSSNAVSRILITLQGDDVAPRFDLCTEVLIAEASGGMLAGEPKTMLLPGPSADELCGLVIKENVSVVVCGGIEDPHYQYLRWKKVRVVDRVVGPADEVLRMALGGGLAEGAIVRGKAGP